MSFLNQTNTGKRCPEDVNHLRNRILKRKGGPDSSMMRYISVYCWDLAMVLDRLEVLENFVDEMKQLAKKRLEPL